MRLLDLFCGAGGAGMGYHRAGFEVVGVDIKPMPRYPFEFHQADALEYLAAHGHEFDVIHASPPCQGYSRLAFVRNMDNYPRIIEQLRDLLLQTVKPYIIENVPDAPLINPLTLCGTMFGLKTHKHRIFEIEPPVYFAPAGCTKARVKPRGSGKRLAQYFGLDAAMVTVAGHLFSHAAGSRALGIDWMNRDELAEAIPPAYTEFIGGQLVALLQRLTPSPMTAT